MNRFQVIARKVTLQDRITEQDALYLYEEFHDLVALGQLAEARNFQLNQDVVFYNINRHINPTNICALSCKFCAYSRKIGEPGSYAYSIETMVEKAGEAVQQGATEVHMVGGLHPRWGFDHYVKMIAAVKEAFPKLHIKAFTAVELDWLARKSRQTVPQVLEQLRSVGLGSLPGGGAEIFHPEIRDQICDTKVSAENWLDTHRTAHQMGMHSNATMLYGHIEKLHHRVDHMARLRALQDETGGFNAFIPLAFQPFQNEMGITRYTLGSDDLKTIAIARLFLDNFRHIKAYWIMLGQDVAQVALNFGANDIDGTVIEEKISRMAGGRSGMAMSRSLIKNLIERAGRLPVERDTLYHPLEDLPTRTASVDSSVDRLEVAEILRGDQGRAAPSGAAGPSDHWDSQAHFKRLKRLTEIGSPYDLVQMARLSRSQKAGVLVNGENSPPDLLTEAAPAQVHFTTGRYLSLFWQPSSGSHTGELVLSATRRVGQQAQGASHGQNPAGSLGSLGSLDTVAPAQDLAGGVRAKVLVEINLKNLDGESLGAAQKFLADWYQSPGLDLLAGGQSQHSDVYLDLSALGEVAGSHGPSLKAQLKSVAQLLKTLEAPIHVQGLKALWRLCRGQQSELLALVQDMGQWGVTSIQSSFGETEMDLTSREILTLHRTVAQGGLWSIGKLEIVAPALQSSAMLGDHGPMWESFLKRAETLGQLFLGPQGLAEVRVEVAPESFVTPRDYLKAVAIARAALPTCPGGLMLSAPFLSLPTLGLARGEGSQLFQHPAEKIAPLVVYFGAESFGALDDMVVSPKALQQLLSASGIEVKGPSCPPVLSTQFSAPESAAPKPRFIRDSSTEVNPLGEAFL